MRGRHFGFLATLCTVWIVGRVGYLAMSSEDIVSIAKIAILEPQAQSAGATNPVSVPTEIARSVVPEAIDIFVAAARDVQPVALARPGHAPSIETIRASSDAPPQPWPLTPVTPVPQRAAAGGKSPWSIYAYSYIRGGPRASGPLGGGQYGGGQSGFVGSFALDPDHSIAMTLRGAIAHADTAEREIAAGVRWRPAHNIPLTLVAERRFRNRRADAFAVYAAGGLSQATLPHEFRLDAFAQAGLVSGRGGGAFFDVTGRAERMVASVGTTPVILGGGLWGGGQESIFRIDTGPTIGTEIDLGPANMRIHADWRFRIAGDARPASGPALTLSTSF